MSEVVRMVGNNKAGRNCVLQPDQIEDSVVRMSNLPSLSYLIPSKQTNASTESPPDVSPTSEHDPRTHAFQLEDSLKRPYAEIKKLFEGKAAESVYCKGVKVKAGGNIIYKICALNDPTAEMQTTTEQFNLECRYAQSASEHSIGPKVTHFYIVSENNDGEHPAYGVIAMEAFLEKHSMKERIQVYDKFRRYERTGRELFKSCNHESCSEPMMPFDEVFAKAFARTVWKMWNECQFMHMDLHADNVFYTNNPASKEMVVYFIDYGIVIPRKDLETASLETPYTNEKFAEKFTSVYSALSYSTFDLQSLAEVFVDNQYLLTNVYANYIKPTLTTVPKEVSPRGGAIQHVDTKSGYAAEMLHGEARSVDPSFPLLSLLGTALPTEENDASNSSSIDALYGDEADIQRYNEIVNDFQLIGEWVEFMSVGIRIIYPFNTGYGGRMVSIRYFANKLRHIKKMDDESRQLGGKFPRGFPEAFQTGLHNADAIRTAVERTHISNIDGFYLGILRMVQRLIPKVFAQGRSQFLARENPNLQLPDGELYRSTSKNTSMQVKIGNFIFDFMHHALVGADVVVPQGVQLSEEHLIDIAMFRLVTFLQTTFIEGGVRDEAGESPPIAYRAFETTRHDTTYWGWDAVLARFQLHVRAYFHPYGDFKTNRGIEVINTDQLFQAEFLRRYRRPAQDNHYLVLPEFHVEVAARILYVVVYPKHLEAIRKILPWHVHIDYGLPRFDRKQRSYGFGTYKIFPIHYEDAALALYQKMVDHARKVNEQLEKRTDLSDELRAEYQEAARYQGMFASMKYDQSWLEYDLNPMRKEGTLADATGMMDGVLDL